MGDVVGGVISLLVAVVFLVKSVDLTLGTFVQPGSGLWPLIISIFLIILGMFILVNGLTRWKERKAEEAVNLPMPAAGIASVLVYLFFWENFGYFIPSIALLLFWLRFMGNESWVLSAAIAVSVTVFFYVLFVYWLKLPIPMEFTL